jgi:hypothetical protein
MKKLWLASLLTIAVVFAQANNGTAKSNTRIPAKGGKKTTGGYIEYPSFGETNTQSSATGSGGVGSRSGKTSVNDINIVSKGKTNPNEVNIGSKKGKTISTGSVGGGSGKTSVKEINIGSKKGKTISTGSVGGGSGKTSVNEINIGSKKGKTISKVNQQPPPKRPQAAPPRKEAVKKPK